MLTLLDCFYEPSNVDEKHDEKLKWVQKWQAENDKCSQEGGIISSEDRRLLWGSYGRSSDPKGGASLHDVRDKYYDTEEKYSKLVAIRRQVYPDFIFTANMFAVDANTAPKGKQRTLSLRGYGPVCEDDVEGTTPIVETTGTSIFKMIFLPNCFTQLE